jgi:catechol 2,3-dioxygenase-like lactoylglutathione lyase family enzyme
MILGFAHPGLVVPDLDRAREFYEKMFGFRLHCEEGWSEDDAADRATGGSNSICRGYTLAGHNCYLELFEFEAPSPSGPAPQALGAHEPGIRHLAFFVKNCHAEHRRLLQLGGIELGEPTDIGNGIYTVYCRDPFGNIIELCDIPTPEEDPCNLPGIRCLDNYSG